jgi:hypothetical protein
VDVRHGQGVQIGAGGVQHNFFAGRPPIAWPHRVGVVPTLADEYQDRRAGHELDRAVRAGETAMLTQVLSGLGGVGKTQLAAGYAHHAWRTGAVDLLLWVTAASRSAIIAGYAQAAGDLTGTDDLDPEQATARLLAWLASTAKRWLIVLDDLQTPADLTGLWPPRTPSGRTVVTTRRHDAALATAGRHLVDVGLYTPAEAATYLAHKLHDAPDLLAEADELAADLGYLPLALAQAAAYLLDRGLSCAAYRSRLADRQSKLADLLPEPDALPDEHRSTVAATWALSVEAADRLTPAGLARPVLELAALLDPNAIPRTAFTAPAARRYIGTRSDGGSRLADADAAHDALHNLHRLNLVTVDRSAGVVRIHALVQRATRDQLAPQQLHDVARTAANALLETWATPEPEESHSQMLRANAAVLSRSAGDALHTPDVHAVLFRVGRSLGEAGQVAAAAAHFTDLQDRCVRALGPEHRQTLSIRHNAAYWSGETGDAAGALKAFEQLLTDELSVLGPDDHSTLITRANLAHYRGEVGDVRGAIAALEDLLADESRALGADHVQTLNTRSQLARWRGEAGGAAGAVEAYQQLLSDTLRVLGPDHKDTLGARINLARWQGEAGDAAGAVAAFEGLLAERFRMLGPDHPATLHARNLVARWRGVSGDAAGAVEAFEQLLADRLRVLGPDHPDTLTTHANIAYWRGKAGDLRGAAAAAEQLLADQVRVLGPDHPNTLGTRSQVMQWRGQTGDLRGAAAAAEQLLADRLRVVGPDHPDTLATRAHAAYWREVANDQTGDATAHESLLADYLRILGPDHPHTLIIRANLAHRLGRAGNATAALEAFQQLLDDRLRLLGPDHPDTLTTRHDLARWRRAAGDRAGAIKAFQDLLTDLVRVLGADHPDTLRGPT